MKNSSFIIVCCLIAMTNRASAHTWRVNNDATKHPDFTTIPDAVAAAAPGDTLHIEASKTVYGNFVLNKPLVIVGNGYFLGGGALEATKDSSVINGITIDSSSVTANASGSNISGITFLSTVSLLHNVHDITITRCSLPGQLTFVAFDRPSDNINITKCFLQVNVAESNITATLDITFENNIFSSALGNTGGAVNLGANTSGLFRNNTINTNAGAFTFNNFYISNNVFASATITALDGNNNIIRNNTFAAPTVTNVTNGVDGNQTSVDMSALFKGSLTAGYGDSRYQTSGPGPLRASGETISGITPDRGAYNTVTATDTYRTSGIPAIPTIYALTVPVSVPATATTLDITVSTRSNN